MEMSEHSEQLVGSPIQYFWLYFQIPQEYVGTFVQGGNEGAQRGIGGKPNPTCEQLSPYYSKWLLNTWHTHPQIHTHTKGGSSGQNLDFAR